MAVLTADEFYAKYHSKDTWHHEVMDTMENLASDGLTEKIVKSIAGRDRWDIE